MKRVTKSLLTGVIALGLFAPVATSVVNQSHITVNAKRHRRHYRRNRTRLSARRCRRDIKKAFHLFYHCTGLKKTHQSRNQMKFSTMTGTRENDYLTVTKYGRKLHIRWSIYYNNGRKQTHFHTKYRTVRY